MSNISSKVILLTNAIINTNHLLTVLLADPLIPADHKAYIKERMRYNAVALNIAKEQEAINA